MKKTKITRGQYEKIKEKWEQYPNINYSFRLEKFQTNDGIVKAYAVIAIYDTLIYDKEIKKVFIKNIKKCEKTIKRFNKKYQIVLFDKVSK